MSPTRAERTEQRTAAALRQPRVAARQGTAEEKPAAAQRDRLRDLVALGLVASIALVITALATFDPADPPAACVFPQHPRASNACGLFGSAVATSLYASFGFAAWPLVALAVLAVVAGWTLPGGFGLANLLEQARPVGTEATSSGGFVFGNLVSPAEYESHVGAIHATATMTAFTTALAGVLLAATMYLWKIVSPALVAGMLKPAYTFLANRWYVDELYNALFVLPTLGIARLASGFDRTVIDRIIDGVAWAARQLAGIDAWIDRNLVDGLVNATAAATWNSGLWLKQLQTGRLRQYVMFIVVGTVALFVLASLVFRTSLVG